MFADLIIKGRSICPVNEKVYATQKILGMQAGTTYSNTAYPKLNSYETKIFVNIGNFNKKEKTTAIDKSLLHIYFQYQNVEFRLQPISIAISIATTHLYLELNIIYI